MTSDKPTRDKPKMLYWALFTLVIAAVIFGASLHSPMWMDEYLFYKLASDFPDYHSEADWFFKDRPSMLAPSVDWEEIDPEKAMRAIYDTPIFVHTPLAVILVSPVVKGLNYLADKEIIPHIEEQPGAVASTADPEDYAAQRAETITTILRLIFPIGLFIASSYLIFKLLWFKVGASAYFFALPMTLLIQVLIGNYLFYWDVFMMFFFTLALYLMETKPKSRWKYVAACCLVNTKMFLGIVFLLPLIVKALKEGGWKSGLKMVLPALSILPFYFTTVIVTGDLFYPFTHYLAATYIHTWVYTSLVTPANWLELLIQPCMPLYIILTVPILFMWRRYPVYATLFLITTAYAWGTGLGLTHISTQLCVGAMVAPLVMHRFGAMKKLLYCLNKWSFFKSKKPKGDIEIR